MTFSFLFQFSVAVFGSGNRILPGLLLGWSPSLCESQVGVSKLGHELCVAVVWKQGVCRCVCVDLMKSKRASIYWDFRDSGEALLLIKWTIFIQHVFF